jgi:hypothetical protein
VPFSLDSLLAAIRAAIPVARILAGITTTQIDDRAVAILESLVNSTTLIDFLRLILSSQDVLKLSGDARTEAILSAASLHRSETVHGELSSLGIGWQELINALPAIVRLILTVLGIRG